MKRLSLPHYYTRSGAKFESTENFLNNTEVVDTNTQSLKSAGVPIAQIDHDTYATTKDEMHCFIIGETGCGKTRRVILPSIRLMAKTGESMIISDPKGELYRYTSDVLTKRGYDVKVLNFRNPRLGNRWNPLAIIEELFRANTTEKVDKASLMLNDIVSILSQGIASQDDPYWATTAASLFLGVVQMILTFGNEGDLTFENVAITADTIYKLYSTSPSRLDNSLKTLKENLDALPKNSIIMENISSFANNADSTRSCIYSVFKSMLAPYRDQELLNDLMCKSEIDLMSIGEKSTALFIILPDDSDAMYPIATCFIKQSYSVLVNLADSQPTGQLPNKVTFLLDEFANFAKLPTIHAMLTAARSRRIRFVLVCQSMDQLIEKYSESGMEIMISNCRVWLYMSCRNLPFLKRLEELMGEYHSPYTREICPLVSISDLQHFEMGQILVLNDRCKPVIGYLDDYSKYDFGEEGFGKENSSIDVRELQKRTLFNLNRALNDYKYREKTAMHEKIMDEKKEYDRSEEIKKALDLIDIDVESILDDDTPSTKEDDEASDSSSKETDKSNLKEAQDYIDRIKSNPHDIVAKNNLAYMIRRSLVDPDKLNAPFILSVRDLLREGREKREPFSMMNYALYCIENELYEHACFQMRYIDKEGFKKIINYWFVELWYKNTDPEGALVSFIAYRCNALDDLHDMYKMAISEMASEMFAVARSNPKFSKFLHCDSVKQWLSTFLS